MIAIGVWLGLVSAIWALLHSTFHVWGRGWRLEAGDAVAADVRVCIPARNEAGRIGRAVRAALDAPVHEVVVVDDASEDGTAEEARAIADERLVVRTAGPRPKGWAGKPWACAEAARGATARWLLFVDADVIVDRRAPSTAVRRAEGDEASLLSLFGTWELVGFWERVAIPAIGWFVRGAIDLDAVNGSGGGLFPSFANGQFLLVRRDVYEAFGGHAAVRDAVLDDVGLAEVARGAGARLRLLWAPWAFRVRLYQGLGEIVAGYRKNLGRKPALAVAGSALVAATTVVPVLLVPIFPWHPALSAWALAVTFAAIAFRWRLERRDGRSGTIAILHPLAGLVLSGVLLASIGRKASWKGRQFLNGRAQ